MGSEVSGCHLGRGCWYGGFFFFNDTATTEIYTLSLHDALPILPAERLRRGFVHSLIPIALVYVAAHYLTFLLFEGQGILSLASDPLGEGWDLFGSADRAIDFGVISQNGAWYVQVGLVIAGHVAALLLAHDRALTLYDDARRAARSQYWMLAVMIGFTTLALWLLAQAGSATNAGEGSSDAVATSDRLVAFEKRPPYVNGLAVD